MTFIDIHTHNSEVEKDTIKVVNLFPDVFDPLVVPQFASVGLHPWYVKENFAEQISLLENIARNNKIIAIGEAGLDKAVKVDFDLQKQVFMVQAKIAEKLSMPMIIHAVKTYYDLIALRKNFIKAPQWIIHGFNGNEKVANDLIKNNFYLSFGKDLLNENKHTCKSISSIPLEKIFFETDATDLNIRNVYDNAAGILNICVEKLSTQINNNFQQLFNVDLKQ